ncbi:response regulator [Calothrix rhizosoleniae]|uniref:response regulator n=1 Tax=Calothrix rhizosoleniae TaxID=888997 RepID=UPI000B4978E8|nr:response regulator [Calothrix rhizosoleniae]
MTLANILFVDDEPRGIKNFIDELIFSGYQVNFQNNIDSAEKYLQQHHNTIQLVILDIMMPPGETLRMQDTDNGMKTGILFRNKIRSDFPELPIILFTNFHPDPQLKQEIHDDPKSLLLQKYNYLPFELVEVVQNFFNLS